MTEPREPYLTRAITADDVIRARLLLETFERHVIDQQPGTLAEHLLDTHRDYGGNLKTPVHDQRVGDEFVAQEIHRAHLTLEALTRQLLTGREEQVPARDTYLSTVCAVPGCPWPATLRLCLHHELLGEDDKAGDP